MFTKVRTYGASHLRSFSRIAGTSRHLHTSPQPTVHPIHHLRGLSAVSKKAFQPASQRWQSNVSEEQKTFKGQSASSSGQGDNEIKKSKSIRSGGRKTSLRRVAVEAQRSRDKLVLGTKGLRFVNPDIETKVCLRLGASSKQSS